VTQQLALDTPVPAATPAAGTGPRPLVIGIDSSLTSLGIATPAERSTNRQYPQVECSFRGIL
jgi:hypothetical protein